jgi:signal transduction histidine kinase
VLGVIYFASKAANAYSLDDARIAYMLSLQLAGALRNVQAYELIARKEAELRTYAEKLEETNMELDAFAHTIAHDLKTPLSSIIIKADLMRLRYGDGDPDLQRQTKQMREAAFKMSEMIGQLLWLARLRDVREMVEKVKVREIVVDAVKRFSDPIAHAGIDVHIAEGIPNAMGHTQWVEEVFANLISNAIKYMGDDNPTPKITITGERQGEVVKYAVADSGVGIAEDDQAHLFEMFTRLHTVNTEGLGLGLSIVHRIIKKLGGDLGVESELGKGSTFWFTLPAISSD